MAKRILNYTVGDENYTHQKFKSVSGSDDYPGANNPVRDKDPQIFSFLLDDKLIDPILLICGD